jgi:predicted metalloprotease with PDZ domain
MIGVNAQTITSALAAGLRLPRDWGVVLADVVPGGPADEAGLRIGDVVVTLDGKPMENGRQLDVNLYRRKIGDRVKLEVLRGSQSHAFTVRVVERTNDPERFIELVSPERNLVAKLGVLGLDLDAGIAQSIVPPPRRTTGVIVAASSTSSLHREEVFIPGEASAAPSSC